MKRIIIMASALILALSLCACDGAKKDGAASPTPARTTQATPTTQATQTAPAPTETPSPNTPEPSEGRGNQTEDADVPNWWGEYKCSDTNFSVGITNFNGQSFLFSFFNLRNGELFYDGAAALDPDNSLVADYGDISFSLSDDFNAIDISAPESSEWSHLSGRYERIADDTANGEKHSLDIAFDLNGLWWESGNEYILDDEVKVYSDTLGDGNDIRTQIEDYLSLGDRRVSKWLSLDSDESLTAKTGYPVWIAEYYVGLEEDTDLCLDAVVLADDTGSEYAMILHTVRDADLDLNSDMDFNARIWQLFAAIEVVTV